MFKTPKPQSPGPQPDPNDLENRRNGERKSRLTTGGRQSTLLAQAIERAATTPSGRLNGSGG